MQVGNRIPTLTARQIERAPGRSANGFRLHVDSTRSLSKGAVQDVALADEALRSRDSIPGFRGRVPFLRNVGGTLYGNHPPGTFFRFCLGRSLRFVVPSFPASGGSSFWEQIPRPGFRHRVPFRKFGVGLRCQDPGQVSFLASCRRFPNRMKGTRHTLVQLQNPVPFLISLPPGHIFAPLIH